MKKLFYIFAVLVSVNAYAAEVPWVWKSKAQIEAALKVISIDNSDDEINYIKLISPKYEEPYVYEALVGSCIYEIKVKDEYVHRIAGPQGDFFKYKGYLKNKSCD